MSKIEDDDKRKIFSISEEYRKKVNTILAEVPNSSRFICEAIIEKYDKMQNPDNLQTQVMQIIQNMVTANQQLQALFGGQLANPLILNAGISQSKGITPSSLDETDTRLKQVEETQSAEEVKADSSLQQNDSTVKNADETSTTNNKEQIKVVEEKVIEEKVIVEENQEELTKNREEAMRKFSSW